MPHSNVSGVIKLLWTYMNNTPFVFFNLSFKVHTHELKRVINILNFNKSRDKKYYITLQLKCLYK